MTVSITELKSIATSIRRSILRATTQAGSGHPSSSLSATDVMTMLMFGGYFEADFEDTLNKNNDRLIFSKGHSSPLLYALYHELGQMSEEELMSLRKFGSQIEGHPTMDWKYTEAPTGSLGQGLGIGAGMALSAKMDSRDFNTFVLMGDSEMAEGSVWEVMAFASHYKLDNLIGIIDVNRLGQRGQTMYGHDIDSYQTKAEAFGWETQVIDGHDLQAISKAFDEVLHNSQSKEKPKMIVAKTLKGKGVSIMEDQEGWHGKALTQQQLAEALQELV